ncbi:MAG: hypothetical protein GY754_41495 [bacterium]|nr:hypothetical protein [bacterium]
MLLVERCRGCCFYSSSGINIDILSPVIQAIPEDVLQSANMPFDVYIQEAENLFKWVQADKDALTGRGMDWGLVDDLLERAAALREAESIWSAQRFTRQEAGRLWAEKSPDAYALRDQLLKDLRFAYRKDSKLTGRVNYISDGTGHADMIQDLNDLSVLGKENLDPLKQIKFDMPLLDDAAMLSKEMAALFADATTDKAEDKGAKKIRDQALTHLKEAVEEIRDYGQYVFSASRERLQGYRSDYYRKKRYRKSSAKAEDVVSDAASGSASE